LMVSRPFVLLARYVPLIQKRGMDPSFLKE